MKTLPIIAILCLTVMMVFPSTLPRVHAINSNGNNYWAVYGPNVDNILYTDYQDFTGMFTDFQNGQLDITDWPVQPGDLASFVGNPDMFVLTKQPEFGIFQLDINHQNPLFGFASATDSWQAARTAGTPALVSVSTVACVGCSANSFRLTIQLQNLEEANAAIKDSNNFVTATIAGTSLPTATKADDGGAAPTGTYSVGILSDATGITGYGISTTIYSGTVTLPTAGAGACLNQQSCTYAFRVNYNSGSTVKVSSSGAAMSKALSHLVNKPQYLTGPWLTPSGGTPLAACLDVQAPPSQNLMAGAGACDASSSVPSATLSAECADANIVALGVCTPVSLYNLKSNTVAGAATCAAGTVGISCFPSQSATPPSVGYASNIDLAAACVYFLEAGFTTTGAGAGTIAQQCQNVAAGTGHVTNPAGSCNTSTGVGCIDFLVRTSAPRKAFGTIQADELNYLFGTAAPAGGTVCYGGPPALSCSLTPVYYSIGQIASIVFDVSVKADWNLYTGGFTLGTTPDQLWALYHSQFASNICDPTATVNTEPNDYPMFCDPALDTQANAGEFVAGVTFPAFQQAAILGATKGMTVPIYSGANVFASLNAWSQQQVSPGTAASTVGIKGRGFIAGGNWLLNMAPVSGYVPSNALYYASGCNPSTGCAQNTMRRGLSQGTLHISAYTFTTVWEAEPLIQIYDTMLATDVNTGGLCQTQPGGTAHCIDWMTKEHTATFDATTGLLTQLWPLRSDIFFTDGVPVTPHDVCFSILSYRDAPSANFFPSVSNVVNCTVVASTHGPAAQVVLTGNSPFSELNIGGVFIVPEHVWAPLCGGLQTGTDKCVNPTALASTAFDPVAAGDMVGSGPWVCNPSVGVSTISGQASCTQNANGSPGGQALSPGGRLLLKRNEGYMRCCTDTVSPQNGKVTTNLQALSWADANKDGKVTILDIAAVATAFGTTDAYFAHPLYSTPNDGTVNIGDVATVASYIDDGMTSPFLGTPTGPHTATPPAGLTQIDTNTDPYRIDLGSGNFLYIQGATISGTTMTLVTDPCVGCTWAVLTDDPTGTNIPLRWDRDVLHRPVCTERLISATCSIAGFTTSTHFDIAVYRNLGGVQIAFIEFKAGI